MPTSQRGKLRSGKEPSQLQDPSVHPWVTVGDFCLALSQQSRTLGQTTIHTLSPTHALRSNLAESRLCPLVFSLDLDA